MRKSTRDRKFNCLQCGECCRWPGHVLLSNDDITAMARLLGLTEEAFIQRYTRLASNRCRLSLIEKPDGSCVFLSADNACAVYAARPFQCRGYPREWSVAGCPAEGTEC